MSGLLGLPSNFILYDLEYTCWEGVQERSWSGPGEHREIVEIGAIKVNGERLAEIDSFDIYVRPRINFKLSKFFIQLTSTTQEKIDLEGISFPEALNKFSTWVGDYPLAAFGRDDEVIAENCLLNGIEMPFDHSRFINMRLFFKRYGIPADKYMSSNIMQAFGKEQERKEHLGLNDARSILDALRLLAHREKLLV